VRRPLGATRPVLLFLLTALVALQVMGRIPHAEAHDVGSLGAQPQGVCAHDAHAHDGQRMLSTSRSATRSEVDAPAPPSGPGVSSPVAGVPTPYAEVSHGLSYVGWLSRSRVSTVDLQVFRC